MPFIVDTCTAQHIGDRDEQQDRVGLFAHPAKKGALLAVVADGMGGHTGGAMAAEQVVHSARTNFLCSALASDEIRDLLASNINDAHAAIRLAHLSGEQEPHSTAAMLIIHRGRADWAHCGDTRIYHFRNGDLVSRSWDHSHVMSLVKEGYMTEQQAAEHPQKNLLISCLGDESPPQIEFGSCDPLAEGDGFLLCTDGLWGYFSDQELAQVINDYPPRQAAEMLIQGARERAGGRGDNVSFVILRVNYIAEKRPLPPWRRTPPKQGE